MTPDTLDALLAVLRRHDVTTAQIDGNTYQLAPARVEMSRPVPHEASPVDELAKILQLDGE